MADYSEQLYPAEDNPKVLHAQVAILYDYLPNIIVSSTLAAVILAVVLWNTIAPNIIITWLIILGISFAIRAWLYHQYQQQQPSVKDAPRWKRYFFYSALFTFICWGAGGVFLFPHHAPFYQAFTILTLFAIASAATNSLAILRHFSFVFLLIILAPVCIMLLLESQGADYGLVVAIGLYTLFLLNASRTSYKKHLENITLRLTSTAREKKIRLEKRKGSINERRLLEAEKIAHMGSWEWDIASDKMYWSQETFRIFGLNPKTTSPTMKTFVEHIHPSQQAEVQQAFEQAITAEKACSQHVQIQTKSGIKTIHCKGKPIRNRMKKVVRLSGMVHDISKQIALEEQLQHAQKMESVGILAGGIAHDFNNMLGSLIGQTYLAKKEVKGNTKLLTRLENIERISNRAADVVQQLLVFARKDNFKLQPLNFTSFLQSASTLSEAAIPENIQVHYQFDNKVLHIQGDTSQLQQTMLNLLNNATHALSQQRKPEITISLEYFTPDTQFQQLHHIDHSPMAHLSIRDNGCGMSADSMQHIFEPFYTTKGVGEGTGLGLAMVHGAVQSHQGIITVESVEGQGTTFHMYFPIFKTEENIQNQSSSLQRMIQTSELHESILLVDDEKILRESLQEALQSLGYQVFTAHDGQHAVEVFQKYEKSIRLVVSDIVMPNMDGHEAAKQIRHINPDVPFIFMSGYDPQQFSAQDELPQSIIVRKPLRIDILHQHIQSFLADPEENLNKSV